MLSIDPKEVSIPALHAYLQSAVAPRPIALASTIDKEGHINLSPFSFFNVFGTHPPTLIFSPNRRVRDGSTKHTLQNVLEHDEVVIHMVDYAMVEQMSLSSCEYEAGVNEFVKAGFTQIASTLVLPPRIAEAKAAFECKVNQVIQMGQEGGAANLVICQVIMAHFADDILDEKGKIDQLKTDWVARMGGDYYCRASGAAIFEVPKPNKHKGVGVDQIPDYIRTLPLLDSNDLGRLGNIERIPTPKEVTAFKQAQLRYDLDVLAKELLQEGRVAEAWMALLKG